MSKKLLSLILLFLLLFYGITGCFEKDKVKLELDLSLKLNNENKEEIYVKIPVQRAFNPSKLNEKTNSGRFEYVVENDTKFMIISFTETINVSVDKKVNTEYNITKHFPLLEFSNEHIGFKPDENITYDESINDTYDHNYVYIYMDNNNNNNNNNNPINFRYYHYVSYHGYSWSKIKNTKIQTGWNKIRYYSQSEQP